MGSADYWRWPVLVGRGGDSECVAVIDSNAVNIGRYARDIVDRIDPACELCGEDIEREQCARCYCVGCGNLIQECECGEAA